MTRDFEIEARQWMERCHRTGQALTVALEEREAQDEIIRKVHEIAKSARSLRGSDFERTRSRRPSSGDFYMLSFALDEALGYAADKSSEHSCGDYPAPCNCDDPLTHDGHGGKS